MSVYSKMKAICDNIRLRTGGTALLTLDEIAEAILTIGGNVDTSEWVHQAIGATFCPTQLGGESDVEGYDIDIVNATADDVYSYIDAVANNYPSYATKEVLGKDESGQYDIARYILANRQKCAWCKQNYPKMYAWESDGTEGTPDQTVVVPAKASVIVGYRYSLSGGAFKENSTGSNPTSAVVLPLPKEITGDVSITLQNMTKSSYYGSVYLGTANNAFAKEAYVTPNTTTAFTLKNSDYSSFVAVGGYNFATFFVTSTGASGQYDNAKILVNGEEVAFEICTADNITASQESTTIIEGTPGTPGETVYSTSISPRIGDTLYTTPYIGTSKGAVTAVSATNRSRTVGTTEYIRYADGDIEPTVIYTEVEDSRNSNASITQNSVKYNRYPLGDLGENGTKLKPIFIYANEHGNDKTYTTENIAPTAGGGTEGKLPSLVASRFIRDLCSGANASNAFYKYIKENCMMIIIPVANPWGYNYNVSVDTNAYGGYYNANHININRNYDTAGWDTLTSSQDLFTRGEYVGSENETQYIMNTMVESGAVVAMSLHGFWSRQGYCLHQGQQPDWTDFNQEKLAKVVAFIKDNYGYTLDYYDNAPCQNTPNVTSKSPSYITQSGCYGAIVEFTEDDVRTSAFERDMNGYVIENAYCQMLNLMAMWLSDYLENV